MSLIMVVFEELLSVPLSNNGSNEHRSPSPVVSVPDVGNNVFSDVVYRLFLYISSSLAQSDPTFLDLSINPTITVGQSFNATWRWSGMRIPYAHPLIVTVGQDNQASTTTTSTASPGVNTGVVQLQVSETG